MDDQVAAALDIRRPTVLGLAGTAASRVTDPHMADNGPAGDAGRWSGASLTAAALALERARGAVAALEAFGVPAAILAPTGHLRAANTLWDGVAHVARPLPSGRMALSNPSADKRFLDAISHSPGVDERGCSIPVPDRDGGRAFVVRLAALSRPAPEPVHRSDLLMTVTRVGGRRRAPSPEVLAGLFELTPAEARVADGIARGLSLKQVADLHGLRLSTARAYLDQVFRKTGTHRQGELVALLGSADAFH